MFDEEVNLKTVLRNSSDDECVLYIRTRKCECGCGLVFSRLYEDDDIIRESTDEKYAYENYNSHLRTKKKLGWFVVDEPKISCSDSFISSEDERAKALQRLRG